MPPRSLLPVLAAAAAVPPLADALTTLARPPAVDRPDPGLPGRLERMRPHLTGVPVVCYLPAGYAEVLADPAASPAAAVRANLELFLAQRVLAPSLVRIFDVDPNVAWTLGNFADRNTVPADWRERGLELVADHGDGLVLWKPRGR